jgi:hypothetical protein
MASNSIFTQPVVGLLDLDQRGNQVISWVGTAPREQLFKVTEDQPDLREGAQEIKKGGGCNRISQPSVEPETVLLRDATEKTFRFFYLCASVFICGFKDWGGSELS